MIRVLMAVLAQSEPPWDLLKSAERIGPSGHVSELPAEVRKLDGKWITLEGHVLAMTEDGALKKLWLTRDVWMELEKFGTPRTPFNSMRIAFEPDRMPADIEAYESLRVSGRFRIRRELQGAAISDLFWLVDAVEGRKPEPKETDRPRAAPPAAAAARISYSTLALGPDAPEVKSVAGRWVTLSGNVLATSVDEETREFILAKNPWDGCCMGTPPTALDSVAIRMRTKLGNRFARTATVSGVLTVAPRSIHGELAELYFLTDAVEGAVAADDPTSAALPWTWILLALFALLTLGAAWLLRRPRAP